VANGTTTNITIQFAPGALGTLSDDVDIVTDEDTLNVTLTGKGAEIVATFAEPADYAFGQVTKDSGPQHTFVITNTGIPNLVITDVSLTGTDAARFSEASGAGSVTVGNTTNITVTYLSDVLGVHTCNLEIVSNNGGTAPFTNSIELTGEAILPDLNATAGTLTIDTDTLKITHVDGGTTEYMGTLANNTVTWTFDDVTIGSGLTTVTLQGANAVKIAATGDDDGFGDITIQKDLDLVGDNGGGNGSTGAARNLGGGAGGDDYQLGANDDGESGAYDAYTRPGVGGGQTLAANDNKGAGGGGFGGAGAAGGNSNVPGGASYGRLDLALLGTVGGPVGGSGGGGDLQGSGGAGGGALQLIAARHLTVASGVAISAAGGSGGGIDGSDGGSGGSGGAINLVADSDLDGTGTLTLNGSTNDVSGGNGHWKPEPNTGNNTAAGGGGGGRVVLRGATVVSPATNVLSGGVPSDGTGTRSNADDGSVLIDAQGGTLSLAGGGVAANAYGGYTSLSVSSNATLAVGDTNSVGTMIVSNNVTLAGTLKIDVAGSGSGSEDMLTVTGSLDISSATLDFDAITAPDVDTHVIMQYASGGLTGTFAATNDMPSGYSIDYAYSGGTQIALVPGIPNIGIVTLSPMDIGLVATNTTDTGIVTVTNSGLGNVMVTNVTFGSAKFNDTAPSLPAMIAAGASIDITVEFAPGSDQGFTSTLMRVYSTDTASNPTNITVQGTGVNPGIPDIVIVSGPIDFGDVGHTTTGTASVVVSNANPGVLSLYITNLVFTGADSAKFDTVDSAPFNIEVAAGATASFDIEYAPGGVTGVTHYATLEIGSDDPDGTPDYIEFENADRDLLDPYDAATNHDADGDGALKDAEKTMGTHPNKVDTDGDGLWDGAEDKNQDGIMDTGETDPCDPDSDDDGFDDFAERVGGSDPRSASSTPSGIPPEDADSDGIPDTWEIARVGRMDILGGTYSGTSRPRDYDGDGQSDLHEYLASTQVLNAADHFSIQDCSSSYSQVTLQWRTVVGREYQVQHTSDLLSGSWETLSDVYTATTARASAMITVPGGGGSRSFLRVRVNER